MQIQKLGQPVDLQQISEKSLTPQNRTNTQALSRRQPLNLGGIQNFNKKQINFMSSYSNGPAQPFIAVTEIPGSSHSGSVQESTQQSDQ